MQRHLLISRIISNAKSILFGINLSLIMKQKKNMKVIILVKLINKNQVSNENNTNIRKNFRRLPNERLRSKIRLPVVIHTRLPF